MHHAAGFGERTAIAGTAALGDEEREGQWGVVVGRLLSYSDFEQGTEAKG